MSTPPRVAVIMRSKNSDQVINQALAGLAAQEFTDYELLVVDSGSTDRTLEIVAQYPARLKQIAPSDYIPGKVLNEAIASTDAEIVVFQNSDVAPLNTRALSELVAAFDAPDVVAAFARQTPRLEADTWVRRDYAVSFPARGEAPPWITLSLPFAAMRRSAWEARHFYGGAWGSEDTEWGCRARADGQRIAYVPSSIVMHSHNYTPRQLYGRRFIEGEADAFIYAGARWSLRKAWGRFVAGILRDAAAHVSARDIRGLVETPARRAADALGYHRGRMHGQRRLQTGDRDTGLGQRVVLERHDSARSNG